MRATFIYSEEEVKAALLTYHDKKISFNSNKYNVTCELDYGTEKEFLVFVEEKEKDPVTMSTLKNKIRYYINLAFTGGY